MRCVFGSIEWFKLANLSEKKFVSPAMDSPDRLTSTDRGRRIQGVLRVFAFCK
jgi:hypothetical protein